MAEVPVSLAQVLCLVAGGPRQLVTVINSRSVATSGDLY
jgi:hypothetical protein